MEFAFATWDSTDLYTTTISTLKSFVESDTKRNQIFNMLKDWSEGNNETFVKMLFEFCLLTKSFSVDKSLLMIRNGKWGLNHPSFESFKDLEKKEQLKIEKPLEIGDDGIYTCKRCKQTKCLYYSRQVRRADEPPSIFIFCQNKDCKFSWRED